MDKNSIFSPKNHSFAVKWIPVAGAVLLIIILAFFVAGKKATVAAEKKMQAKKTEKKINVVTLRMQKETIRDKINLPGIIEPDIQLFVSAEVAGSVVEKPVKEGDNVEKGDIIAVIDEAKYINNFNAAKASYESATATFKRLNKLYKSQLSNKSDLEAITADVENRKAALEVARLDLQKCRVKAPINGTINKLMYETGQFLDIGNVVAEIIKIDKVKLKVGIPESDVNDVRHINHFTITIDALDNRTFDAKKNYLSKTTGNLARLYDLELIIDNPNEIILPDMFARVDIVKQTFDSAMIVPLYSLITLNEQNIVYIEENGIAKAINVQTGIQEGWLIQVTEGISPQDKVIVVGHRSVSDNQPVKVTRLINDIKEL